MEKLYRKLARPLIADKAYVPLIKGKHAFHVFKRASEAQAHSLKVRNRLERLRTFARLQKEATANGWRAFSHPLGPVAFEKHLPDGSVLVAPVYGQLAD